MNTNRHQVTRNHSRNSPAPQPKTTKSEAIGFVLTPTDTGKSIAGFDLTAAEFSRIQAAVGKWAKVPIQGRDLGTFIREALLKSANRELFPGYPMQELESAVGQAKGVLRLALEHQSFVLGMEHNDHATERSFELVALCGATTDSLQSAFNSAWNYAAGRAA